MVTQISAPANVRHTIQQKALAALTANATDQTQDATIVTQAATVTGNAGTALTATQLTTIVKSLAQGLSMLASHDQITKKELGALIRLALTKFDSTSGT